MKRIGFVPDLCNGPENEAIVAKVKELAAEGKIEELFLLAGPYANVNVFNGHVKLTHFKSLKDRDPTEMFFDHLQTLRGTEKFKEVHVVIIVSHYATARWDAKFSRESDKRLRVSESKLPIMFFHRVQAVSPPRTLKSFRHGYLKNLLKEPLKIAMDLMSPRD
jgi:hypothetical protein